MRVVASSSSLFVILLLAITTSIDSFHTITPIRRPSLTTTPLSAVLIVSPSSSHPVNDDESTYQNILDQARHYAYSETTTSQQAQQYLRYILELQSDCVAGTVVGTNICDNIMELVDIVAHLRQKANQQQLIMASSKEMMALTTVVTMVVASSMWMNTFPTSSDAAVQPFTMEEWRWAIRDGYFNTMVAHYMRHGGL